MSELLTQDNLLKKCADVVANNRFVGDCIFSKDEISMMFDVGQSLAQSYSLGRMNQIPARYKELLFILLVTIAKDFKSDEYKEGYWEGYWDFVSSHLLEGDRSQKWDAALRDVIYELGAAKKIIPITKTKRY
jgi:hypothetical protein